MSRVMDGPKRRQPFCEARHHLRNCPPWEGAEGAIGEEGERLLVP